MIPLFPYKWTLKDSSFTEDKGNVFSCFACGGGSTMGYKLAGFKVLGANEIDKEMAACYKLNHNPKYLFVEDIKKFNLRRDIPKELYNLDILDGSPPCSSFSMAGDRQKQWGKEKKFKEGQMNQVLDNLFFDFIETAKLLQPKVVIAENVKGLIQGNAKHYVSRIFRDFDKAGYEVNHWLLDSSVMGIPQKRERVFFIALKKDLVKKVKPLILNFNCRLITFAEAELENCLSRQLTENKKQYYILTKWGKSLSTIHPKGHWFNDIRLHPNKPVPTLAANNAGLVYHYSKPWSLNENQWKILQSFPMDYKHYKEKDLRYLIGMSVPPVMMAQIANQVYIQWLSKLKRK